MPTDDIQPVLAFGSAFAASAFAGLAAMLKFSKQVTLLAIFESMLYSGLIGLAIALLWYNYFREHGSVYTLLGICILAGLCGAKASDLVLHFVRKGGVKIVISRDDEDEGPLLPEEKE